MRIHCPFCGERDVSEFVYRGDASPARPEAEAGADAVFEQVYLRANPAGRMEEHWYHTRGCRTWLVVVRDTRTHKIECARLAREEAS